MIKYALSDDISVLKGIGSKKKEQLSAAGIETIYDLLSYYPVKYKDRRHLTRAMDAVTDKDSLTCGKLIKVQLRPLSGGRSLTECTLRDDSCVFYAVFFNMPYLRKSLITGQDYVLFGRMKIRNGARVWTNPEFSKAGGERDVRGIYPVYRHSAGLTDINLRKWIREALDYTDLEQDWIGKNITEKRKLCGPGFALGNIHFPESEKHYKAARYRLIYEKLLMYQLAVRINAAGAEDTEYDSSVPEQDMTPFYDGLPFELTEGQSGCISDIMTDLSSRRSMNRLVQGDVGCGKTIIAFLSCVLCASNGYQSAFMAPTEVLAAQHFTKFKELNERYSLNLNIAFLSGSTTAAQRKDILSGLSDGSINLVVGTHALIEDNIEFEDLALVITDEQHRFGVLQRETLNQKGNAPHILSLSATPIPRTLASVYYTGLQVSVIKDKPSNRIPIKTGLRSAEDRLDGLRFLYTKVKAGQQAIIVCPMIEENEDTNLSNVTDYAKFLKDLMPKDVRIGILHGRMKNNEKNRVMQYFANGDIDILVSTTVIEVGIDVPNATVILIENAERFGLATLHQLRGRVGRGKLESFCILINGSGKEEENERLNVMLESDDGFYIADEDLRLRGPGDLTGVRQSGDVRFKIADIYRDRDLFFKAKEFADALY